MRFRSIRLAEQVEQKFRECPYKKEDGNGPSRRLVQSSKRAKYMTGYPCDSKIALSELKT